MPATCPKCQKNTLYKNKGISPKTGRPYENNKCSSCQFLEWIPVGGGTPSSFIKSLPETPHTPAPASETAIQALVGEISAMRQEQKEMFDFLKNSLGE